MLRGFNPEVSFTAPQLKPRFYLFQRVRNQLYLTPPTLEEHTSSAGVYLGVLDFTQPLEKLVLHAVPLQSLLDWLSQPKGPNLVEASAAAVPDKALVLAVTKRMLYGEETPLVGVGLMYKPHYISTEPFSAAYMHLHVWHATGSSVESANKLSSSRLIFVTVLEMSDVISVAAHHLVLLDVATKETMKRTGEPMAPLSFRGFRLHTVWNQPPGGDSVRQVAFPRLLGEATTSMLEYEQEEFPQSLMQGPKMVINLGPPSSDHWNIVSDLILPLTIDKYKQWHEAKRATEEKEESLPPREAVLPREVSEEDILPKRYEIFTSYHDWVQSIRCSLLGLEAGTMPSRRDIDNSSCFVPRAAASESDLPEVITDHWLPILRREGLLVECPPDQFTTPADWVPLYTREGL